MEFSEFWLREWVNPAIDSKTLADQITMVGLAVDAIYPVAGFCSGVIIGQIVECWQHPNVHKLWMTKVNIGKKHTLNIICDAPNCRADLRVAVAPVNALLPGNLRIKANEIHGVSSEGKLCSFSELEISNDHSGIIELPVDAPIGSDIRDYLQLDDNIINISVTSNRADCLSLLGIAREVAVVNRLPLQKLRIEPVVPAINDTLSIYVDVPNACPCYLVRVVKNIDISLNTPFLMKEKLRRCGICPTGTIVDIINYILLELGQPIHIFDLNNIDGIIHVRLAHHGEVLNMLDGSQIILSSDTLVIADQRKALTIAGIFGSTHSNITPYTCDIMLGCAFFNQSAIGCAPCYNLHTSSFYRYERCVDHALQQIAIERATTLLIAIYGGQPGPVVNVTNVEALPQPKIINLRRAKLDKLVGYAISDYDINDIFTRLGCQVTQTKDCWQVMAPSWRFDITIEEDLVEEIIRIYGYDTIPKIPIHTNLKISNHRQTVVPLSRVKNLLVDRGYQEVITYSFINHKIQELLYPEQSPLLLPSPISVEMSAMRLSLWTGLLNTVVYNQNRQQQRIRLFESGLCFVPHSTANLGVRQNLMIAGVITGPRFNEHWDLVCHSVDFYDVKGDLEAILELVGKLDDTEFKAHANSALHPGQSAAIYLKDEIIGLIGVIHPLLEEKLNLHSRTMVFELYWEKFVEYKVPKFNNISPFPVNRRDIAIVVAEDIPAVDIIAECKKVGSHQLISINLFDVYRGKGIAEGFKSLAFSLILQDAAYTLTEKEINTIVARCVTALKHRFKASLRNEKHVAY